jgi:hypothetical protein
VGRSERHHEINGGRSIDRSRFEAAPEVMTGICENDFAEAIWRC